MMTWDLQQEFNITHKDYAFKTLMQFLLNNDKRVFSDINDIGIKYIIEGHPIIPDIVINGVLYKYLDSFDKYHRRYNAIAEFYLSMSIEKFKKVEVHEVMKIEEGSRLTYVIVLTTKADALIDNPGSLDAQISGYYNARDFYAPAPNAQPSLSDYRSTIHWQPNIKTDENGKATVSFYNTL